MTLGRLTTVLILAAGLAGGCTSDRYRTQPLGQVPYSAAFEAGKDAMASRFQIASADDATVKIVARPKAVETGRDRLLGTTPARKVAQMRIREKGGQVYADVLVAIQRQDAPAMRAFRPVTPDTERPTQGPAQETAMLSPEQNMAWENSGRDAAAEREILADIVRHLAPAEK